MKKSEFLQLQEFGVNRKIIKLNNNEVGIKTFKRYYAQEI